MNDQVLLNSVNLRFTIFEVNRHDMLMEMNSNVERFFMLRLLVLKYY